MPSKGNEMDNADATCGMWGIAFCGELLGTRCT